MSKQITFIRMGDNGKSYTYKFRKSSIIFFISFAITLPIFCSFVVWEYFKLYKENYSLEFAYTEITNKYSLLEVDIKRINNYLAYLDAAKDENISDIFISKANYHPVELLSTSSQNNPSPQNTNLILNIPKKQKSITPTNPNSLEGVNLEEFNAAEEALELDEESIASYEELSKAEVEKILKKVNLNNSDNNSTNTDFYPEETNLENITKQESTIEIVENSNSQNTSNSAEQALPNNETNTSEESNIEKTILETGISFNEKAVEPKDIKVSYSRYSNLIAIDFDLYNLSNKTIKGDCHFLLLKEGDINNTRDLIKHSYTSFQMANMKQINTELEPSRGVVTTKDRIKMDILLDDKVVYTEILPIS